MKKVEKGESNNNTELKKRTFPVKKKYVRFDYCGKKRFKLIREEVRNG